MPKSDDNYLRGWCRQVQHALDEGTELGYEAAELIEALLDLISSRDSDSEVELADSGGGGGAPEAHQEPLAGAIQAHLPGVPGVGPAVEHRANGDNDPARVPRGTGSGTSVLTEVSNVCKRRANAPA